MNLDQISDLIRNRRTLTPPIFTGEIIEDHIIKRLLENANWAPNHRKTEPWRFHVFSGEALSKLGDDFQRIYREYMPEDKFSEIKYKKLKSKMEKSSHVITICMQRDAEERVPEWEELAAVSCAVQNLWLSVTAAGLGGYWSSPALMINHADRFLSLAEREKCLGFFYLGIPKNVELKSERRDWAEKVKWYK